MKPQMRCPFYKEPVAKLFAAQKRPFEASCIPTSSATLLGRPPSAGHGRRLVDLKNLIFSLAWSFATASKLLFFLLAAGSLFAQMQNHYILGTNGIESAVKTPGWTSSEIYTFYHATRVNNPKGDKVKLFGSKSHTDIQYLQNFLSYFSQWQLLGGQYGFQILVPFETISADIIVFNQSFTSTQNKFRLSDIYFEPLDLRWNWNQVSLFLAYGFYAPTGRYKPFSLKNSGTGDWGQLVTLATTLFFDQRRTFSFSYFANYEIHSKKKKIDFTAGDNFCLEWGLGKKFEETITMGIVGYYEKQTTNDKGKDVPKRFRKTKDQVYSLGPEIDIALKNPRGNLTFRYEWELGSRSRTQGKTLTALAAFNY